MDAQGSTACTNAFEDVESVLCHSLEAKVQKHMSKVCQQKRKCDKFGKRLDPAVLLNAMNQSMQRVYLTMVRGLEKRVVWWKTLDCAEQTSWVLD